MNITMHMTSMCIRATIALQSAAKYGVHTFSEQGLMNCLNRERWQGLKHCRSFSIHCCALLAHEQKVIRSLQLLEIFPTMMR